MSFSEYVEEEARKAIATLGLRVQEELKVFCRELGLEPWEHPELVLSPKRMVLAFFEYYGGYFKEEKAVALYGIILAGAEKVPEAGYDALKFTLAHECHHHWTYITGIIEENPRWRLEELADKFAEKVTGFSRAKYDEYRNIVREALLENYIEWKERRRKWRK